MFIDFVFFLIYYCTDIRATDTNKERLKNVVNILL